MAHFDFTRAGGVWTGSPALLTAEIADLDSKTERAINGDDGGTWAPTTTINIGGQGVTVTGVFISSECQGLELTAGDLTVYSGARVLLAGGKAEVATGSEIEVQSGATLEVQSGGIVRFNSGSDVDFLGNIEIESGAAMIYRSGSQHIANSGSATSFGGTITFSGRATFSGPSGRTVRRLFSATNANVTVGPDDCDYAYWDCTNANNYTLTLKNNGTAIPVEGERIIVRLRSSGGGFRSIADEVNGTIINPSTADFMVTVVYVGVQGSGGRWRVFAVSDPALVTSQG
jgi:hypothetical protein